MTLTTEERALIDAHLAENGATKIPDGVGTEPVYQWCRKEKRLVQIAGAELTWRKQQKGRQIPPAVAERRQRLRDFMSAGGLASDFARQEGVAVATVYADAKKIGRRFRDIGNSGRTTPADLDARRAKVRKMIDQGMSTSQITAELGITKSMAVRGRKAIKNGK